jgi:flagellar biosynthesis repressor protein FlbT
MSLKIKLKPHDKIIVNGAVIAADEKPVVITFLNNARILRQDDILLDSQIHEAMKADGGYYNDSWLYYLIQLIYIEPENSAEIQDQLEATIKLLCGEYPEKTDDINEILALMAEGHFFKALKACKKTFPDCLAPKGKILKNPESDTHNGETSTAI